MQESAERSETVNIDIPLAKDNASVSVNVGTDEALYLVGPNGTGKSTLLYRLARHHDATTLIAGNREIVFNSSAISISAADAGQHERIASNKINNEGARVEKAHHNDTSRLNRLLFRLKALSDDVNKRYRQAHLNHEHNQLESINAEEPTELVNQTLAFASIPVRLDWNDKSELLAKREIVNMASKKCLTGKGLLSSWLVRHCWPNNPALCL